MDSLLQDFRYSVRLFLKRPGFTATVVLTLALAIGINTSVFCIVNSVLIDPLPFKDPDQLVLVWEKDFQKGRSQERVSAPNFIDWREQNTVFEGMAAFDSSVFVLTGAGEPETIPGSRISTNLLWLLGVTPVLGRAFSQTDEQPGQDKVVLVSHKLWQRRFGSDPNLVGQFLTLDNKSYLVVGVMGPNFQFPQWLQPAGRKTIEQPPGLWAPLTFDADQLATRDGRYLRTIARLKPGFRLAQAQVGMESIAQALQQAYKENENYSVTVMPLHQQIVGTVKPALLILLGAVGFVLLIACANVANLLLARATARQKEIAIRLAMGTTRLRLVRQFLTESILLAFLGGAVGLLLAYWGVGLIVQAVPDGIPRATEISISGQGLGFTMGISMLTGILFGLIPALQSSKLDLGEVLKEGSRSSAAFGGPTRSFLVVSEITLALVLLICAGLMIKSFLHLVSVSPGFNPENVIAMRIALPSSEYGQGHQKVSFFKQLVGRIENLPGVLSAGVATNVPLSGSNMLFTFTVEGRPPVPGEDRSAQFHAISPNYFRVMGIPILKGRGFTEEGIENAPSVVIINETLARRFFPDQDPLGSKLKITSGKTVVREIVGVVQDVKHSSLDAESHADVYVPYFQNPSSFMTLVARTSSDPTTMVAVLKSQVWELDKDQPIDSVNTVEQLLSNSIARPSFYAKLLAIFAAMALLLAAMGIYGVMSFWVAQRTHEIGIRMALGAQKRDVLVLVARQALSLALAGVVLGLLLAVAVTRIMTSLLYQVSSFDPLTFFAISFLAIAIALLASFLPAHRATKIDPMLALRYE
ncbi:MAG: ABC transporter permease [Blastocatellia bacterium]